MPGSRDLSLAIAFATSLLPCWVLDCLAACSSGSQPPKACDGNAVRQDWSKIRAENIGRGVRVCGMVFTAFFVMLHTDCFA